MPTIGGPNSKFERRLNENLAPLSRSIDFRTRRITEILEDAYINANASAKYWRGVRTQIDAQYKILRQLYKTWSNKNIPMAYRESMRELFTRLNRSKDIARRARRGLNDLVTTSRTFQIQKILIRDSIADWNEALNLGRQNIVRLTRRTQQTLLTEATINRSVAEAIQSGNLLNNTFIKTSGVSESLASQLNAVAEVIDGKKYVIAGNRRFSPKYYAEMVSRVKFHEAQAQAAVQTAGNYGTSLVQVSNHNTRTAICVPFENKIFSVNGQDKRFPPLADIPPFHPNCLHLLFPIFESALQAEGTLNSWVEFSQGEVARPPSPAGFIPVGDRTLV